MYPSTARDREGRWTVCNDVGKESVKPFARAPACMIRQNGNQCGGRGETTYTTCGIPTGHIKEVRDVLEIFRVGIISWDAASHVGDGARSIWVHVAIERGDSLGRRTLSTIIGG